MRPVPRDLRLLPFRGSEMIAKGQLTRAELRTPRWLRLLPDVYIAADVPMDHRMWCRAAWVYAASAHGTASAFSGLSAAMLWGVDLLPAGAPAQLTVPLDVRLRHRPPHLIVVRSPLRPGDVASFGPVPLTSPDRTAFDLARQLTRSDAIVTLDALAHRRIIASANRAPDRHRPRPLANFCAPTVVSRAQQRPPVRKTWWILARPRPRCAACWGGVGWRASQQGVDSASRAGCLRIAAKP